MYALKPNIIRLAKQETLFYDPRHISPPPHMRHHFTFATRQTTDAYIDLRRNNLAEVTFKVFQYCVSVTETMLMIEYSLVTGLVVVVVVFSSASSNPPPLLLFLFLIIVIFFLCLPLLIHLLF